MRFALVTAAATFATILRVMTATGRPSLLDHCGKQRLLRLAEIAIWPTRG